MSKPKMNFVAGRKAMGVFAKALEGLSPDQVERAVDAVFQNGKWRDCQRCGGDCSINGVLCPACEGEGKVFVVHGSGGVTNSRAGVEITALAKVSTNVSRKPIRDVYAVFDADGKLINIVHRPSRVMGLKGWSVLKGQFVPNKRQATR